MVVLVIRFDLLLAIAIVDHQTGGLRLSLFRNVAKPVQPFHVGAIRQVKMCYPVVR